ncbi:PQQ-binding-like beta-propeller repeat protein [Fodinibius sp. N2]|uniref:outer membrane protein assembly factor BamB family protein n=1 Tax=Fodinibius alkaliphilus TaxID=3140241 RepID=UPI00315AB0D6
MKYLIKRTDNSLILVLICAVGLFISSCASTQKAGIPISWQNNFDWENYNSAEVTETEHVIVQNKTDILIYDAKTGQEVFSDIKEKKGLLGQFGDHLKEQALGGLSTKNNVEIKYWHYTLPDSKVLLLFDRSDDEGGVRAIDLESGRELWNNQNLQWNLEEYRNLAEGITELAAKVSLGSGATAGIASEVLLQTRAIQSMIMEVPEKDAFLFRTVDGALHLLNSKTGSLLWKTGQFSSTGVAAVQYLKQSDDLLVAGDMGNLKDLIKTIDSNETVKQLHRIDAESGAMKWASKYKGREDQLAYLELRDQLALLYFSGGSLEFFNVKDGTRLFGTRDEFGMGDAKVASAVSSTNTLETVKTAMPVIDGNEVYAINPTGKMNSFALDDKVVTKFNYKTGELLWTSPVLEKTPDVHDIHLTNKSVIITIPGGGNVVGGSKQAGLYAFDKESGKPHWHFGDQLGKKYIPNMLPVESHIWTGGDNALYKLNMENGELITDHQFDEYDLGNISVIQKTARNELALIGSKGMGLLDSEMPDSVYYGDIDGRVRDWVGNDSRLLIKGEKVLSSRETLYVFDLNDNTLITDLTLTFPSKKVYGDLAARGYIAVDNFRKVLTINENGIKAFQL